MTMWPNKTLERTRMGAGHAVVAIERHRPRSSGFAQLGSLGRSA
jgi:hypothetical protein